MSLKNNEYCNKNECITDTNNINKWEAFAALLGIVLAFIICIESYNYIKLNFL